MSTLKTENRILQITKLVRNPAEVAALRVHLEELIHGEVFGGSPRSQQFLRYVIEKSIECDFDSLKERVIGIELFGRSPSYDTGEDAIVRVSASDVRKRLLQHYGRLGNGSEFRIDIPPGSYVPEIIWTPHADSSSIQSPVPLPKPEFDEMANPAPGPPPKIASPFRNKAAFFSVSLVFLFLALSFWVGYHSHDPKPPKPDPTVLPWSVILGSGHPLQIIASDPDLATLEDITGHPISLADYADRKYIPDDSKLSPELRNFYLKYLGGTRAADIDLLIVGRIITLAAPKVERIHISNARHFNLDDFHTDDDFILLGSPLSNPWVELFSQQLDFRFVFSDKLAFEVIEDAKPRGKELKVYSPLFNGFDSKPQLRDSYATIAFFQNPHQLGHVLIVAGTDASSTEGAAQLVTNITDLTSALHNCEGPTNEPLQDFELLLKFNDVDRSVVNTEVIACHRLGP